MAQRASRQEILVEAQRLVGAGVSRRKMDTILREKFGRSIGHTTHIKIFKQRVSAIRVKEEARPKGFKLPRSNKERNFNTLRKAHFLPKEARLMVRSLTTLRYREVTIMVAQRKELYDSFLHRRTYSPSEFHREWVKAVENWYDENAAKWRREFELFHRERGHQVRRRRGLFDLLWAWFGHVKKELPPELQSETPKKRKRRRQKRRVTTSMVKKSQKINSLEAQLRRENRPSVRAFLRGLIEKEQAK